MSQLTINRCIAVITWMVLSSRLVLHVTGQSNYGSQANNVEYPVEGKLPEEATLDGKVTKLDDLSPIIFLNRTKAALNCGAGSMQVELKFNEPFYGKAYADFDRNSACQIQGKGDISNKIELPLKGCGTKQEPQRVFTNNIVVRFHPGLEMDGDEIITIVCRYPPPIAPIPAGLPASIVTDLIPAPIVGPPLKGIQILFIICAIMFLTLVLLGLGVSYYCLRRRPLIVHRRALPMGSGSEITKLSTSSLGSISHFEGLKIPRATPLAVVHHSSSGSDGPHISDTIPSDYPSESHSESGSLPNSSAESYENPAFVSESIYSEQYEIREANAQQTVVPRLPMAIKESSPKFDVQVRVKRAPPAPPSPMTSDTESVATSRGDRNNLSTIMESREDRESILTIESEPQEVAHSHFTYTPELHPAPRHIQQPPVSKRIIHKQQEIRQQRQPWIDDYTDGPAIDSRSLASLGTEMTDTHSVSEMIVDASHYAPQTTYHSSVHLEQVDSLPEPPIAVMRKPEITSHVVDDVFMRTITEKKTIEDTEKYKRMVTEYQVKPIPDPTWDVTIRNYPNEDQNQNRWEDFSDISSASGMTLTPKMERAELSLPPVNYISDSAKKLMSPELVGNMKPIEMPEEDKAVPNWDVLIRILEQPELTEVPDDTSSVHSTNFLARQLSYEDKTKWKEIITTESVLRKQLTEAVVREDFERIRADVRYERLFEPHTWDVIVRILAPPDDDIEFRQPKKFKKKEAWDTRSRRSSLPTLYEYDSDGGSSVRTITNDPTMPHHSGYTQYPPRSSNRTSVRSSYRSDNVDMRSMSEVIVDFGRPERSDSYSDASSYNPRYYEDDPYDRRSIQRSLSHPSLARSASEFTERWIAPEHGSEISSPEGTPKSRRSQRIMTTFQPRPPPPPRDGQRMVAQTQYIEETRTTSYQAGSAPSRDWYSSDPNREMKF